MTTRSCVRRATCYAIELSITQYTRRVYTLNSYHARTVAPRDIRLLFTSTVFSLRELISLAVHRFRPTYQGATMGQGSLPWQRVNSLNHSAIYIPIIQCVCASMLHALMPMLSKDTSIERTKRRTRRKEKVTPTREEGQRKRATHATE